MPRTRRVIPGQLPMLMTGNEIKDFVHGSADMPSLVNRKHGDAETLAYKDEQWKGLWGRKQRDNDRPERADFVRSVATEGVRQHITISPRTHVYRDDNDERQEQEVWVHGEGHHRTQASSRIEDTTGKKVYLPVVFDEDPLHQQGQEPRPGRSLRRR